MNEMERQLIKMIRESDGPEIALELAIAVLEELLAKEQLTISA